MGRTQNMTWEGHPNYRWVKMYRGKRYRVSCDELGVPRSKDESYQAANHWWKTRLLEIGLRSVDPDKRQALAEIEAKLKYAASHAPDLVPGLKISAARIAGEPPDEVVLDDEAVIEQNLEIARLMGVSVPEDLDRTVLQQIFGNRRLWQERFKRASFVEKQKTIRHNLDKFLAEQRLRQKPATHDELAEYFKKLTEASNVWAEQTDVATINEQTVTDHYIWLTSKNLGPGQHNKRLGFFRRFILWLWEQKQLDELPRNLKRKEHRKKKVHKEVKRFSGIAEVIKSLPSPCRLWALLGLNCGMTNADLGETTWEQIDQQSWTLTRRRAKTGDLPSTPTVTYKLWPETIESLKTLSTRSGLLFLTKTGQPLYQTKYNSDGKVEKKDLFATYWNRLKSKPAMSLGKFRSVAAKALKEDKLYRQYVDYFLAHAPKSIADQHYGAEANKPFFEATDFIRKVVLDVQTATGRQSRTGKTLKL